MILNGSGNGYQDRVRLHSSQPRASQPPRSAGPPPGPVEQPLVVFSRWRTSPCLDSTRSTLRGPRNPDGHGHGQTQFEARLEARRQAEALDEEEWKAVSARLVPSLGSEHFKNF